MDNAAGEEIQAKIARLENSILACIAQTERLEREVEASRAQKERLEGELEAYKQLLRPEQHSLPTLEVISYRPGGPQERGPARTNNPRWKSAFDQVRLATSRELYEPSVLIGSLPVSASHHQRRLIEVAWLLGRDAAATSDKHIRSFKELVLTSFCVLLQHLQYYTADEVNNVLRTICAGDSQARYLDTLKRGAQFANSLVAARARASGVDDLEVIGRASQAVCEAGLSISQWGTLNTYGREIKASILAQPLSPPRAHSTPLFIPCVIELLVQSRVLSETICRSLGYQPLDRAVAGRLVESYKMLFPSVAKEVGWQSQVTAAGGWRYKERMGDLFKFGIERASRS